MNGAFPDGFLWGAATSAYQIEGSPLADGAGLSNWHVFSHTPGCTAGGQTGDVACDHYRRWREDIALMRELGLQAYRFSLAWGRVLPEGTGRVNGRGLDFYDRLVDGLLAAGITPLPTLFHWDLPQALDDRGGWANRDCAEWFADYARVVFARLGDRVEQWMTLNEPWVVVDAGYVHGTHAPGKQDLRLAALAAHNLLRGHGLAVRCLRAEAGGRIGIVVNLEPKDPASDSAADLDATRRADAYMNRWYLDPLRLGRYPDEMPDIFGEAWPSFPAGRLRGDRRAHRLPGPELLHAVGQPRRSGRAADGSRAGAPARRAVHRDGLGSAPGEPAPGAGLDARPLRRDAHLHHRERRRPGRPARRRGRACARPAARGLFPFAPARRPRGDR